MNPSIIPAMINKGITPRINFMALFPFIFKASTLLSSFGYNMESASIKPAPLLINMARSSIIPWGSRRPRIGDHSDSY